MPPSTFSLHPAALSAAAAASAKPPAEAHAGGNAALTVVRTVDRIRRWHLRRWRENLVFAAAVSLPVLGWLWTRTPLYVSEALVRVVVSSGAPANSSLLAVRDHRMAMETGAFLGYFFDRIDPQDREVFEAAPGVNFIRTGEVRDSHLIRVKVRSHDRDVAARLANQYAQFYGDYLSFREKESLRSRYEILLRRETAQRVQVERSREALRQFLRDLQAAEGGGVLMERQRLLSQRQSLAREYAAAESALLEAARQRQPSAGEGVSSAQELAGLEDVRRVASQQLEKVDLALERLDSMTAREDSQSARFAGLQAQVDADDQICADLREKLAEMKVALELPAKPEVATEDEARPATRSQPPGRWGSLLISMLVFAGAFGLFPVCREHASVVFSPWGRRSLPQELATLPTLSAKGSRQLLAECFESPTRDALYRVTQELERAFAGEPHQCLLVTSSQEREGKSFVAAALAAVACSQGRRILLVDCHLASPSVGLWFPRADSGCGMLEWLQTRGDGTRQLSCQRQGDGGEGELYVVTSRGWASDPAALLAQPCLATWLRRAREEFDWVILDGPEASSSGEAAQLASLTDGVLLVRDSRISTLGDASQACRKLTAAGGRMLGTIENRTEALG